MKVFRSSTDSSTSSTCGIPAPPSGFWPGRLPLFRSVFFIAVTAAAILIILQYLRKARVEELSLVAALALIVAGAVGNLIDRVRFGEVVDFLDVYIGTYHWPAFNVADSAITCGAILLAMILLNGGRTGRRDGERGWPRRFPLKWRVRSRRIEDR